MELDNITYSDLAIFRQKSFPFSQTQFYQYSGRQGMADALFRNPFNDLKPDTGNATDHPAPYLKI